MSSHTEFILSSSSRTLNDVVSATSGIGGGIETFPLCDYVMQSVFLKMTGSQEQKMKCIIWELATIDFDYRRAVLANDDRLGECSSYDDKNKIYKRLVGQIQKYNPKFDVTTDIDSAKILTETISYITTLFHNTNLSIWAQSSFTWFVKNKTTVIRLEHFARRDTKGKTNLFESSLQDKYEMLYNHRNRIAHNTHSYQQNLPTLKTLASENQVYENYFVYFSILMIIDEVFRALYRKYLEAVQDSRV
jgi:hypothetical protein